MPLLQTPILLHLLSKTPSTTRRNSEGLKKRTRYGITLYTLFQSEEQPLRPRVRKVLCPSFPLGRFPYPFREGNPPSWDLLMGPPDPCRCVKRVARENQPCVEGALGSELESLRSPSMIRSGSPYYDGYLCLLFFSRIDFWLLFPGLLSVSVSAGGRLHFLVPSFAFSFVS